MGRAPFPCDGRFSLWRMGKKQQGSNLLRGNPDTQFKTGRKQVETARKGGKASGKAKRAKKTLAETARALLDSPVQPGTKVYNSMKAMGRGMDDEDITIAASIVAAQVNSAMRETPSRSRSCASSWTRHRLSARRSWRTSAC